MRSLVSRWPGELLLPVLVAIVETGTVTPALVLLTGFVLGPSPVWAPWPPALGLLGLLAFWSTRWLASQVVDVGVARVWSLLLWAGVTLLWLIAQHERQWGLAGAVPHLVRDLARPLSGGAPLVATTVLALLSWRRGLSYGSDPAPFNAERLRGLTRGAFIVLAATIAVATVSGAATNALASARLAVPLVVTAGLLAVAAGQLETARLRAVLRHGRAPGRGGWLAFAGGAALLTLLAAFVVSDPLGQDHWQALAAVVLVGVRWASAALIWLLVAVAFLMFLMIYPVIWFIQAATGNQRAGQDTKTQPFTPPDFPRFTEQVQRGLPSDVTRFLNGLSAAAIVALAVLILLSALRRYRTNRHATLVDEDRESLWSRELVLGQLRAAIRRRRTEPASTDSSHLGRTPASVREAFRALSFLAQQHGLGRRVAESASSYSQRLVAAWPDTASAIEDLTARYLRVRYGEWTVAADNERARADWEAVRQARADVDEGARRDSRGR